MSYEVHVVKIEHLEAHPDPAVHSLQVTDLFGYKVIIGKNVTIGTIGLFFPVDGQIGPEFATANDLLRRKDANGNNAGGLFEHNRRVRQQSLRGMKSEGFFIPIQSLAFTGEDYTRLQPGDRITEFGGYLIGQKHVVRKNVQNGPRPRTHQIDNAYFLKHFDTEQFRFAASKVSKGSLIYVTEKLHGTSQRVGKVWVEESIQRKWWQKLLGRPVRTKTVVKPLIGTRNVILGESKPSSFYGEDEIFRQRICEEWVDKLHDGEIVYGEVVGFLPSGNPIMPVHETKHVKDKKFAKLWGDTVTYSYGCAHDHPVKPQMKFYAYRITQTSQDRGSNEPIELSWAQVKRRCEELGIEHVPEIQTVLLPLLYDGDEKFLRELVETFTDGASLLDFHIREGVCLRAEEPHGHVRIVKNKSFVFGVMEGFWKEEAEEKGDGDMEESS